MGTGATRGGTTLTRNASLTSPQDDHASGVGAAGVGAAGHRTVLPLPALAVRSSRAPTLSCAVASIDVNGRVCDKASVRALGWSPGTAVDVRASLSGISATADAQGIHRIDRAGYLRLRVGARRTAQFAVDERLLLLADPDTGVLLIAAVASLSSLFDPQRIAADGRWSDE